MTDAYEGTYDDPANPQPHLTREDHYCRITGSVDFDGDYEVSRWLLEQVSERAAGSWWETFETARAALAYAANLSDIAEGWDPRYVYDLDTGAQYEVRVLADPILTIREVTA